MPMKKNPHAVAYFLTPEDIEQIVEWYNAAAGESATTDGSPEENAKLKALLEKLGIEPHSMDVYQFTHEASR